MPKQTASQETGGAGERGSVSRLPTNWIFQPPLEDVGIDGVVVICGPGAGEGLEFRVQIKSSTRFRRNGEMLIVPNVKRSALRYWVTGFTPTLVVAYETSSASGYCAWANQILASMADSLDVEHGTCALEVPMQTPVNDSAWTIIREQASGIYAAIGRHVLVAGTIVSFLKAMNQLSGALKGLYFAEAARPPEQHRTKEQRELMHELEATSHRDVVRAMLTLHQELMEHGRCLTGLTQYADDYSERVEGFIRGFRKTVASDERVRCQVIAEGFAIERRPLMNSIAGVLHELTQAAVYASRVESDG